MAACSRVFPRRGMGFPTQCAKTPRPVWDWRAWRWQPSVVVWPVARWCRPFGPGDLGAPCSWGSAVAGPGRQRRSPQAISCRPVPGLRGRATRCRCDGAHRRAMDGADRRAMDGAHPRWMVPIAASCTCRRVFPCQAGNGVMAACSRVFPRRGMGFPTRRLKTPRPVWDGAHGGGSHRRCGRQYATRKKTAADL